VLAELNHLKYLHVGFAILKDILESHLHPTHLSQKDIYRDSKAKMHLVVTSKDSAYDRSKVLLYFAHELDDPTTLSLINTNIQL